MVIEDLLKSWSQRKANISCKEVTEALIAMGFEVRNGSRGGHKIFTHDQLPSFYSSSLDCGHGKNPILKRAYISALIRTLRKYKTELEQLQESTHE